MFDIAAVSAYFHWNVALPIVLYLLFLPYVLYRFFCLFSGCPFLRRHGAGYALLSAGLSFLTTGYQLPGSVGLVLETALLAVYGTLLAKKSWRESWMIAVLLRSVFGVIDSIVGWMGYQVFLPLLMKWEAAFLSADAIREFLKILLVTGFLTLILRHFYRSCSGLLQEQLLLFATPLFFIALVEQILQDAFYDGAIMVDTVAGTIRTEVRVSHGENLLLQILAGVCLVVMLLIYQRFSRMQLAERKLLSLTEQAAEQKRYMEEAAIRERQTRAFRHDLNNHLTVLKELLRTGQEEKAWEYLDQLGEAAEGLFCHVQTGNPAVDVLLGSKCTVARQKGIEVQCELSVPEAAAFRDLDWCILLSNAFDNALEACEAVPPGKKYIRLSGRRKGNLYLLLLENSCDEKLKVPPPEGVGLSNIRAVLEPLSGTMEKEVLAGVYKLKLLFPVR